MHLSDKQRRQNWQFAYGLKALVLERKKAAHSIGYNERTPTPLGQAVEWLVIGGVLSKVCPLHPLPNILVF